MFGSRRWRSRLEHDSDQASAHRRGRRVDRGDDAHDPLLRGDRAAARLARARPGQAPLLHPPGRRARARDPSHARPARAHPGGALDPARGRACAGGDPAGDPADRRPGRDQAHARRGARTHHHPARAGAPPPPRARAARVRTRGQAAVGQAASGGDDRVSAVAAPTAGVDRRAMTVLSTGHMFTDIAQGSIPALLPFLITRDHLSYAAASALVLAATIASSVIQPLFGYVSDRLSLPWLMPLGPALGGLGVGLAGLAPSYGLTFAAVVLSGLGVAAFHPEGSRFANYVSGARRASGMSLFSVGGNVGFALGPVLVTPLLLAFGLHGTMFLIIPTW